MIRADAGVKLGENFVVMTGEICCRTSTLASPWYTTNTLEFPYFHKSNWNRVAIEPERLGIAGIEEMLFLLLSLWAYHNFRLLKLENNVSDMKQYRTCSLRGDSSSNLPGFVLAPLLLVAWPRTNILIFWCIGFVCQIGVQILLQLQVLIS